MAMEQRCPIELIGQLDRITRYRIWISSVLLVISWIAMMAANVDEIVQVHDYADMMIDNPLGSSSCIMQLYGIQ